jgi:hypothetical protein
LNRRYSGRTLTLNKRLNDQLEREVTVLTRRMPSRVFGHYRLLAKWRIRLSDAEAMNWGVMEIFSIVFSAAVIIRITWLPHIEPGTIFAMLAILEFPRQPQPRSGPRPAAEPTGCHCAKYDESFRIGAFPYQFRTEEMHLTEGNEEESHDVLLSLLCQPSVTLRSLACSKSKMDYLDIKLILNLPYLLFL